MKNYNERIEDFTKRISKIKSSNYLKRVCRSEINTLKKSLALTSLRRLISHYRNEIRSKFGENHNALNYLKLGKDTIKINKIAAIKAKERRTNIKHVYSFNSMIKEALSLLKSYDWRDITIGLCLLTGRRTSEVLYSAKFKYVENDILSFKGQLKSKSKAIKGYDIFTLCDAKEVIEALSKLRILKTFKSIEDVNNRAAKSLSERVKILFGGYLKGIKIHDLRKLYARHCINEYCINEVENDFLMALLGHKDEDISKDYMTFRVYY